MVPLFLAATVEHLLVHDLLPAPPPDLPALAALRLPRSSPPPDYRGLISPLLSYLIPGEYPAVTAFRLIQAGETLFPHLTGTPLARLLFADTRSVERSAVTRLFQNFTLGAEAFRRVYRLEPELEVHSYLQTEDLPLLSPASRTRLLESWSDGEVDLAAYTLRPSLPPREANDDPAGYSPEAEMALELSGLAPIPIIGYGRIAYLAGRYALETDALTKPAPVQALGAFIAAVDRWELPALESALHLWRDVPLRQDLSHLPPEVMIHVFEDSAGGIEAVRQAGHLLNRWRFQARVQAWGIASHPEKVRALSAAGAPDFPNIDAALEKAL
jgi:hypothetical protein